LSSRSAVHQWKKLGGKVTTIPDFSKNYATVAKMSQHLKKVGYVGIALTRVNAVANISKACTVGTTTACSKAKYTETGNAAGNIGGGIFGGFVTSWGVCTVAFGLPTGGTSAFWCALVAGSAGGYAGGKGLGLLGESLGDELYKVNYSQ
jgi:hypothetical protein